MSTSIVMFQLFTPRERVSVATPEAPERRRWGRWDGTRGCTPSDTCRCRAWPRPTPERTQKTVNSRRRSGRSAQTNYLLLDEETVDGLDVRRHEPVLNPRPGRVQTEAKVQPRININRPKQQHRAAYRPPLFDLLDHAAYEFIDLLQRSGGAEGAEELDPLTGRQQLDGED